MHDYPVFVARPDGTIWPVPGVYAAKIPLLGAGCRLQVHDAFLQLPADLIATHLARTGYRSARPGWAALYVVTETSGGGPPLAWFDALNEHVGHVRALLPEVQWCVMGFFDNDPQRTLPSIFYHAQAHLPYGYDALLAPLLTGRPSRSLRFEGRRFADFIPANGFAWRSAYQMIDMPDCMGHCANCADRPDRCAPGRAKTHSVAQLHVSRAELASHPALFNLQLVGSPLTISHDKYEAISDLLASAARGAEIHLEEDLHHFMTPSNWPDLLARHRYGACTFTVSALGPTAHSAIGMRPLDWLDSLARVRARIGTRACLNVTIVAGMPGDTVRTVEAAINQMEGIVDCVDVVPAVIVKESLLAHAGHYVFDMGDIDRWGYPAWRSPTTSSAELRDWCGAWHVDRLRDPMYCNYRKSSDILFANNEGASSVQVRADLAAAGQQPDSAQWLAQQLRARRHGQILRYRARYGAP